MDWIRKFLKKWAGPARGQSLAEMAIATPLLIFMMIGVFEVGWALRGYLVLVNINREITRFAIRPGYLNFATFDNVEASYQRVRDWVETSGSGQLNMIFSETITGNSTLIVSHIVVDTGLPCADIVTNPDACDCNAFVDAYESGGSYSREFKLDDIIIHPRMPNFEYQAKRFGVPQERDGSPRESRQDYDKIVAELAATNNRFNCEIYKKGGVASANNVMMTELFHDQPQLFGFPIISNPLTDPIPLYTHTTMRMIGAARSAGTSAGSLTRGIDTLGPVCFAYPMVVDSATTHLAEVNLIENGWLKWNPGNSDPNYVTMSLQFPQMSLGEFVDAGGGPNVLRIGSSVAKTPAVAGTNPELTQLLTSLVGNQFLVPTSASPGSSPVTVDGFVWVSIPVESGINLATGTVNAVVDKQTAPPETCATTGLPE